ncbi:hypothetical protein ACFXJ5_10910 [Streptomyces sp. NPDC059373]
MKAVARPTADGGRTFSLGHQLTKMLEPVRFPLRIGNQKPRLWMDLSFVCHLDAEEEYLMVLSSFFGVFASESAKDALFHYDYERNKRDDYPDAHLQVAGQEETLAALLPGRPLPKLHFPVGGKRFRPCLEDVIEFLVREGLAEARDGYKDVLEAGRARFRRNQLRAAMRRSPEIVEDFVREMGLVKD